jgi:hypothetical protein
MNDPEHEHMNDPKHRRLLQLLAMRTFGAKLYDVLGTHMYRGYKWNAFSNEQTLA